jgi:hypothetical protein
MWTEGLGHLEMSRDRTDNLTRDLPFCGAVPEQQMVRVKQLCCNCSINRCEGQALVHVIKIVHIMYSVNWCSTYPVIAFIFINVTYWKLSCFIFFLEQQPNVGQGRLMIELSRSRKGQTTVGRTPLDEGSARRRDLYVARHNTRKRQTSMPTAGFEPAVPASDKPQTLTLDRSVTGMDFVGDKRVYSVCSV